MPLSRPTSTASTGHHGVMTIVARIRQWFAHEVWHILGWVVVSTCAVVLFCRFTGWLPKTSIIGLVSVVLIVVLPAYLVAIIAWAGNHRVLLVASLVICLIHAGLFVSRLDLGTSPHRIAGRATLRVFEANVLFLNTDLSHIAHEIVSDSPDVVIIEELTAEGLDQLRANGAFTGLPYSVERPGGGASGTGIFAKWPLENRTDPLYSEAALLGATLKHPVGNIEIYSVHTRSPTSGRDVWIAQLRDLRKFAAGLNKPTIMAGDYNASTDLKPFRDLVGAGMTDAHEATGRELAGSWPNDTRFWPIMLIDHVLVHGDITPLRTFEGQGRGSDHRPVIADLQLPG